MKIKDLQVMIKEAMDDNSVLLSKPKVLSEANYGVAKRKIEVEMVPFVMITAFRGDETRNENKRNQKKLEKYVSDSKFPFTKMPDSGFIEGPPEEGPPEEESKLKLDLDPLAEGAFDGEESGEASYESEPKEEPLGTEVKENSIIIWDQTRPDKGERTAEDINLFDLGKLLANEYNQDSFVFGGPVTDERTGEREMRARLYDRLGKPIKESWAGPWSTLVQINDDDLFWSTIGSKRGKLVEMLNKYEKMPVQSREDAMKKQHYINAIKSALKKAGAYGKAKKH